jgi:hypothetical protein
VLKHNRRNNQRQPPNHKTPRNQTKSCSGVNNKKANEIIPAAMIATDETTAAGIDKNGNKSTDRLTAGVLLGGVAW